MYEVTFKKSAIKELQKLQKNEKILIIKAIKNLVNDPHPHGCKKLTGGNITWRIRIGNYRVIYDVYDSELIIEIIRVKHRREVYR